LQLAAALGKLCAARTSFDPGENRAQGHAHRNAEVISNWLALMKPRLVFYGAVLVDGTVRPGDEISLMG